MPFRLITKLFLFWGCEKYEYKKTAKDVVILNVRKQLKIEKSCTFQTKISRFYFYTISLVFVLSDIKISCETFISLIRNKLNDFDSHYLDMP